MVDHILAQLTNGGVAVLLSVLVALYAGHRLFRDPQPPRTFRAWWKDQRDFLKQFREQERRIR